jgi:hypothetical protein
MKYIISLPKNKFSLIFKLLAIAVIFSHSISAYAAGEKFYIIAESVSTSIEARRIMHQQGWVEVPLRRADYVLVVVRSELSMPLSGSYRSINDLKRDAEFQLNISGSNFVVYVYSLDEELKPTEVLRRNYKYRD